MKIDKELVVQLNGTAEGFSADAVKEQLAIRQEAVAKQLAKFRRFNEIKEGKK